MSWTPSSTSSPPTCRSNFDASPSLARQQPNGQRDQYHRGWLRYRHKFQYQPAGAIRWSIGHHRVYLAVAVLAEAVHRETVGKDPVGKLRQQKFFYLSGRQIRIE